MRFYLFHRRWRSRERAGHNVLNDKTYHSPSGRPLSFRESYLSSSLTFNFVAMSSTIFYLYALAILHHHYPPLPLYRTQQTPLKPLFIVMCTCDPLLFPFPFPALPLILVTLRSALSLKLLMTNPHVLRGPSCPTDILTHFYHAILEKKGRLSLPPYFDERDRNCRACAHTYTGSTSSISRCHYRVTASTSL